MKFACWRPLAVLALCCCAKAWAAPYPSENELRSAVEASAGLLKIEGLRLEVLDAQKEGLKRPLLAAGLSLDSGACMVFYNTVPEEALAEFFSGIDERDMPIWLNAMAVHEATHCVEQREAYLRERFDRVLPAKLGNGEMTVQGYLSVVRSGAVETWGEVLADIASVLYLKQAVPGRWTEFATTLADMRENRADRWPLHDTSEWLRRVIATNAAYGADQSIFEAAFQLRRDFQSD